MVSLFLVPISSKMDEEQNDADVKKQDKVYDDVFHHIASFSNYQKVLYFVASGLNLLLGPQFGLLVFAMGSPRFRCATNVTCEVNKCCTNCTSYRFDDGQFTSLVTEVTHSQHDSDFSDYVLYLVVVSLYKLLSIVFHSGT